MAWLTGWSYRKAVTIEVAPLSALTNYPVPVIIRNDSNMGTAGAGIDIRFTASDGSTLLSYERERTWTVLGSPTTTYKTNDGTPLSISTSTSTFTRTSHGWTDGKPVKFDSTGYVPTGLTKGVVYYVANATTHTFQVSQTLGGSSVILLSVGTGVVSVFTSTSDQFNGNFWVKVPSLATSVPAVTLYLYYGKASVSDGSNPHSVWDDYYAVYHFNGQVPYGATYRDWPDSSPNDRMLAQGSGSTEEIGSGIGGSWAMGNCLLNGPNGSCNYGTEKLTIETWFYPRAFGTGKYANLSSYPVVLSLVPSSVSASSAYVTLTGPHRTEPDYPPPSNEHAVLWRYVDETAWSLYNWHHFAAVYNGWSGTTQNLDFYYDGAVSNGAKGVTHPYVEGDPWQGPDFGAAGSGVTVAGAPGLIDEFRISTKVRSADWIEYTYRLLRDCSTTTTPAGAEEAPGRSIIAAPVEGTFGALAPTIETTYECEVTIAAPVDLVGTVPLVVAGVEGPANIYVNDVRDVTAAVLAPTVTFGSNPTVLAVLVNARFNVETPAVSTDVNFGVSAQEGTFSISQPTVRAEYSATISVGVVNMTAAIVVPITDQATIAGIDEPVYHRLDQ
jgi:hypothetical protein